MYNKTQRLGADKTYKRPIVTYQEQLSKEDIADKLKGYVKVDTFDDIPVNTHIRYFLLKKGSDPAFRTGGFLKNKMNADIYVILTNGKDSWSVQIKDTIFYRKLSHTEEINALQTELMKKDETISTLKKKCKTADSQEKKLKKTSNDTQIFQSYKNIDEIITDKDIVEPLHSDEYVDVLFTAQPKKKRSKKHKKTKDSESD